jgi:hypothetical protein
MTDDIYFMVDTVGTSTIDQMLGKHGAHRKACPPPTSRFTGQVDILLQLEEYFFPTQTTVKEQHIFVLYGVGGAGKTQIALAFIEKFYHW